MKDVIGVANVRDVCLASNTFWGQCDNLLTYRYVAVTLDNKGKAHTILYVSRYCLYGTYTFKLYCSCLGYMYLTACLIPHLPIPSKLCFSRPWLLFCLRFFCFTRAKVEYFSKS